jgi:hypothetical protein
MKAENLLLATVVWAATTATATSIITASSHGYDANFIADFQFV